jgi:hypothetical protein
MKGGEPYEGRFFSTVPWEHKGENSSRNLILTNGKKALK